jgi:hypothetical protein
MLAENLVDMPYSQNLETETSQINQPSHQEVVAEENLNATIPDDLGLYHSDICCMCQDLIFVLFFKHFLFADNMEVDDDYGSSLDEEPVSHFRYLIHLFFCHSK